MSLVEIKAHMMSVKMASLGSLCSQFQTNPDRMRCMLSHWVGKGRIRLCTKEPACGTKCFKCPTSIVELYEWI